MAEQERQANGGDENGGNVLMFTAFSQDYSLGYICEHVNKTYCARYGYLFRSYVLPYQEIMNKVAPKSHCTWFKVYLIRQVNLN